MNLIDLRMAAVAASLLGGIVLCSCLSPAEERAELDSKVGICSVGGVEFRVREGLAAVRSTSPGNMTLWSQSPSLEIHASSSVDATDDWVIRVLNCMPGSGLTATPSAAGVSTKPLPTKFAKDCAFQVHIPPGEATSLRLAPADQEVSDPFCFAVLGDVQGALDRVGDIYRLINGDPELRFVASPGDLTEDGSERGLGQVEESLSSLHIPVYSTVGNHENGASAELWAERFGRASFHWTFHGSHFSFLDSASAGIDPTVYGWLDAWLALGKDSFHAVVTHYSPMDPVGVRGGSFRSQREAAKLAGLLAGGHVDVTFHGHVHSYYAFQLGNIPAYISGGGGAIPEKMDGIGRHYLKVTVNPAEQTQLVAIVRVD